MFKKNDSHPGWTTLVSKIFLACSLSLLSACARDTQTPGAATLSFHLSGGQYAAQSAGISGLDSADNIDEIHISVSNETGEVAQGAFAASAGKMSLTVPADTPLQVTGSALSAGVEKFRGTVAVTAVPRGGQRAIAFELDPLAPALRLAPANALAQSQGNAVVLTWDPVEGATAYNVYGSTQADSGTNGQLLATVTDTTYTDANLQNGVTYYYVVTAVFADNSQSAPTAQMSATPALDNQALGPIPYKSFSDSPFNGLRFASFYLEDFEDHVLNTPGVSISASNPQPGSNFGSLVDSVDADDGVIDGYGRGESLWADGATGLTFTFDAETLGGLPTYAGVVWTDGSGTTRFEAWDAQGNSLGSIEANIADGTFASTTDEDNFFGQINSGGISAIKISNTSGGIEVDHLQYGK